jgi:hypothetical protein
VILAIQPRFMDLITRQEKNHDFRKYELPNETQHIWFYETEPVNMIRYMAITDIPKRPGEMHLLPGIGNDEGTLSILSHFVMVKCSDGLSKRVSTLVSILFLGGP